MELTACLVFAFLLCCVACLAHLTILESLPSRVPPGPDNHTSADCGRCPIHP